MSKLETPPGSIETIASGHSVEGMNGFVSEDPQTSTATNAPKPNAKATSIPKWRLRGARPDAASSGRERGKSADGKPAEGEEQRLFRDKLRDAKAREADHPEDRELAAARLDRKKERVDEQAQRRERGGPEKKALRAVHVAPRVGHEHRRGLLCRDRLERLPVLVDLRDGGRREEHVGIAAHRTLPFDEARDPDAVCALPADEGQLVADRGEVLDAALGEERLRHQCAVDPLSYGGEGNHRRPLQNAAVGTEIELELHALRARLDGNRGEHPLRHRHGLAVVRRDERLHEHDGSDGRGKALR